MIRIQRTEDRGRVLVATRKLDPGVAGLELLAEEALIIVPPYSHKSHEYPPLPRELANTDPNIWISYWCYKNQSEDTKTKILDHYAELDCANANILRKTLTPIAEREKINVEEFVHVAMIFQYNAVKVNPAAEDGQGPGQNFGRGLFEVACRMSHSCKPNCCWISSQDGTKKLVRLIAPVEEGEELTIAYTEALMRPTHLRRKYLFKSKRFTCHCLHCKQPFDDTRSFPCPVRKCSGLIHVHQPCSSDDPTFQSCTTCQEAATKAAKEKLLREEAFLKQEIVKIEYIVDHCIQVDVTGRIKRLRAPSPHHYLAESCLKIQGELYMQTEEFDLAARANESMVACMDGILGKDYNERTVAWALERQGDSLAMGGNLVRAQTVFQRSVRILQITDGFSQPYTQAAIAKLLNVQKCLLAKNCSESLRPPSGQCALCGAAAGKHWCGGCSDSQNRAFYCCRDHQVAHWKVHKKHSKKNCTGVASKAQK